MLDIPHTKCRVPVGTHFLLSCHYHGTAPMACTVFCISRPCRDALSVVLPLSRHCAHGLYRVLHIASLSGRTFCCLAAITALRPWLVPCFAYRVPVGSPFLLSCRYHGTAPMACTVFCISRPCRVSLSVALPLSRHCAHGLYRVLHIASLSGRTFCCLAAITALLSRLVPCFAYSVPVGTHFLLSCRYHGTAPKACTVLCLSRHFGTQFGHILTNTALRQRLVPCYACRVLSGRSLVTS